MVNKKLEYIDECYFFLETLKSTLCLKKPDRYE